MSTQSAVRISGPRAVIDAIPTLLGFVPTESVVLIFMDEQGRVGLTTRIDIDQVDYDSQWLTPIMDKVFPIIPVPTVLSVVFSAKGHAAFPNLRPWVRMFRYIDVEVRDDVWCDGEEAGSYLCHDDGCCPFPVTLSGNLELDLAKGETTSRLTRDEVAASLAFVGPYEAAPLPIGVVGAVAALQDASADPETWNPAKGATVGAYLRRSLAHRDWLLHLVSVMDLRLPAWLLTDLACHEDEPSALSALASLAYLSGDGGMARMLVDRSPNAGLSMLLDEAMNSALPPGILRDVFENATLDVILGTENATDPRTI